jgi:hypothetical protein
MKGGLIILTWLYRWLVHIIFCSGIIENGDDLGAGCIAYFKTGEG